MSPEINSSQQLREQSFQGLREKGLSENQQYLERFNYELELITDKGFADYFLVLSDVINWAQSKGILVGPSRGSAGGSLIAFCLGIAQLDPIKHELLFERFLTPQRTQPPDIDTDFQKDRRDEVVQYLRDKYGADCVAHIGTFGTMRAKAAIRDVARTLGYEYEMGDKLANLILPPIEGRPQTLETCLDKVTELNKYFKKQGSPEQQILQYALQLENRVRNIGVHASGIVLSPTPITDYLPLFKDPNGEAVTQFDMGDVEAVGLIKFDFLGLATLSTISTCLNLIKQSTGQIINIYKDIPLDDPKTLQMFCNGDLTGIFQFEGSGGMRDLTVQVQPKNLHDLATINALFRPGPLTSKMTEKYVHIRNKKEEESYIIRELEPILSNTHSCIIFQEQIMQIFQHLAGYSLAQTDIIRSAIGKKKIEKLAAAKQDLISGIEKLGYKKEIGEQLFNEIIAFGGYCFNKSHAENYSYISYICAYLKTYYPTQWMCACLTTDSNEVDKVTKYLHYCREIGIKVLPPDINSSDVSFTPSKDLTGIHVGFGAIKNIGSRGEEILSNRAASGPFLSIQDLIKRIPSINSEQVETLILIGAFDSINPNRKALLEMRKSLWDWRDSFKRYESKLETYKKKLNKYNERLEEIRQGAKKSSLKEPIRPELPVSPTLEAQLEDMTLSQKLQAEKQLLGFYLSGHPLDLIDLSSMKSQTIEELMEKEKSLYSVRVVAVPSIIKFITTKKDKLKMAFVVWEDHTGTIESIIQAKTFKNLESTLYLVEQNPQAVEIIGRLEVKENEGTLLRKIIIQDISILSQEEQITTDTKVFKDLAHILNFATDRQMNKKRHTTTTKVIWEKERYNWEFKLKN